MNKLHFVNTGLNIFLSIALGSIGGFAAYFLGSPMPFMLGSFVLTAAFSVFNFSVFGRKPVLPLPLRSIFVGIIGVMIGGSVHPGIFSSFSSLVLPLIGVGIFVITALALNYFLFRKLGGYDRPTAFYAAMPGGLIESIALGEKAGGDPHVLSIQQFARIALVITIVPFLFLFFTGDKVGSAAGVSLTGAETGLTLKDWVVIALCVGFGVTGGKLVRLPAYILTGPMLLSGLVHYTGVMDNGPPYWLIAGAQIVVGAGLGARFQGFRITLIYRVFALAIVSVSGMLVLDVLISLILTSLLHEPFGVYFISFAPGGVTETALIALSLNANPVFVTSLHIFRIVFTVIISGIGSRYLMSGWREKPSG